MKCQIHAFNLKASPELAPDFLKALVKAKSPAIEEEETNTRPARQVHLEEGPDGVFCGVVITIRDQKAFWSALQKGGSLEVAPQDLADRRVAELNFFICYPQKATGLYISYYRSCPASSLGFLLHRGFQDWASEHGVARRKASLSLELMANDQTLAQFLAETSAVKNAQFSYRGLNAVESSFLATSSADDAVRSSHFKAVFGHKHGLLTKARMAVQKWAKDPNVVNYRVEALDEDGHPVLFRLQRDYLSLAELEHDNMVLSVSQKDLDNGLAGTEPIRHLLYLGTQQRVKTLLQV